VWTAAFHWSHVAGPFTSSSPITYRNTSRVRNAVQLIEQVRMRQAIAVPVELPGPVVARSHAQAVGRLAEGILNLHQA
jgi:hypothetical protein